MESDRRNMDLSSPSYAVDGSAELIQDVPIDDIAISGGQFAEWRRNWLLVLAGMAGLSISGMAPYSLGLFMEPLTQAFGWSRGLISSALTVIAVFGIVLTPFVGGLIDRFGPRAVAIPGIILSSLSFAAIGLSTASVLVWFALWSVYAIAVIAVKPLIWSAAISRSFDRGRGLALAVMLSGLAISQTFTPLIAERLIRTHGWRQAYCWLGAGWGGIVLLLVILFFRERAVVAPSGGPLTGVRAAATNLHGPAPARAVIPLLSICDTNIVKIAVASFLLSMVGAGIAVHKVPILVGFGIDRGMAARLAATAGIAGIAGKLVTGWLMDSFRSHIAGAFGMAITGLGVALLLFTGHDWATIIAAMLVLGYGAGASLQVAVYLVSRFAGAASFGRAFGIVSALMALGAGIGPWLFGVTYTAFGDYRPVLVGAVPLCVLCGGLIASLDPLPKRAA